MADDEVNSRCARGGDHPLAILERQRHRLFDKRMFSMGRRNLDLRRVELMRRGDVDGVDVGRAQRLHRVVGGRAEILREARPGFRARIEAGDDLDARVAAERRDHE